MPELDGMRDLDLPAEARSILRANSTDLAQSFMRGLENSGEYVVSIQPLMNGSSRIQCGTLPKDDFYEDQVEADSCLNAIVIQLERRLSRVLR